MKAAIYNPYWDTLGGGERYAISFAKVLTEQGIQVEIEWTGKDILTKLENKFGLDLTGISSVENIKRGDGYDYCFWVSDGSVPLLKSRHNFLHFQIPFRKTNGNSLINRMKFFRIEKIICNSYFTKNVIDREYSVNSSVIYPPVDVRKFSARKKENIILSVARFSQLTQSKHQDILVDAFKSLQPELGNEWKLILAGGSEVGAGDYLKDLRDRAAGSNIEIIENPDFKSLVRFYSEAKIFWTASGFGEDETISPQKVEHFGITLVEALASGCVVLAYNAGGHKETVTESENGFLWNDVEELKGKTLKIINDRKTLKEISKSAKESSSKFGYDRFSEEIKKLL